MDIKQTAQSRDYFLKGNLSIYDYFLLLYHYRFFYLLNSLLLLTIAIIISFILPKWYKATTTILQPKEQLVTPISMGSNLSKGLSNQRLTNSNQMANPYNYLAILKSRSVFEAVINKFDLINVYRVRDNLLEEAIKELESNVKFEIQDEEYLRIEVYDQDPVRAANMANYFVEMLNNQSILLYTKEVKENRIFLEKRISRLNNDLRLLEDSIIAFQSKSKLLIGPSTNDAGISSIAELYAMKTKKEIEVSILEKTLGSGNPALTYHKIELEEINKRISNLPQISINALRIYRDYMILQKTIEYLIPLYEQAKVDEQKTIPVILVLDKAYPPQKKAKPKRIYIVLSAIILSTITWFLLAAKEFYLCGLQIHKPYEYEKIQILKKSLKNILKKQTTM